MSKHYTATVMFATPGSRREGSTIVGGRSVAEAKANVSKTAAFYVSMGHTISGVRMWEQCSECRGLGRLANLEDCRTCKGKNSERELKSW